MVTTNDVVWMDDLADDVCWRLLEGAVVGRVGFVVDGVPIVLPVNFVVEGRSIVLRTATTSLLEGIAGRPVAFEVDAADALAETGWSVVVQGVGEEVIDDSMRSDLAKLPLHPWAPGPRDRWLRIHPTMVSGRAISRRREPGRDGGFLPYMPPD